jgi:membrane protease YdiL (CAAX protease family)
MISESFITKPAYRLSSPLWYLAGIMAVALGYMLGQMPLVWVQLQKVKAYKIGVADVKKFMETNDFSILHINANWGLFLMLCMFIGAWLAYIVLLKIQQVPLLATITGRNSFDLSRYLFGFFVWMGLTLAIELIFYVNKPEVYHWQFDASAFIPLLLMGVTLVPLQSAMEEVFFRGYFMQGLYAATGSIMWSLVVSTLFFSMVHSMNPEIEKYGFWTMQIYYLGAGLFLALLALADNGLELSMGIHAATNVFGSVFLKYEGSVLQTKTLVEQKLENPWPMILSFYLCAVAMWWLSSGKYIFNLSDALKQKQKKDEPFSTGMN